MADSELAVRRIVVGIDGSAPSRAALLRANAEAHAHRCALVVVHAWNFLEQRTATFDPTYDEGKARAMIDRVIEDVLDHDGVDDLTVRMVNDHPSPALLALAPGAFTLVVGARGLGGFKGLLLGSVSQHLVAHAPCPVLVVR